MSLLSGLMGTKAPKTGADSLIKDSDTKSFMTDVIQASREVPVIVDFWAPWCGPCKQLGPMIEKVVTAAGGAVRLVKINIDENPALAQQLRIQSIPMVYAFHHGQPVDGFAGALPESQIKAFVERLAGPIGPAPAEMGIEQAKEAAAMGELDLAAQIYEQVLVEEPTNPAAIGGLARCHLGRGRAAAARQLLEKVPKEIQHHVEIDGARAALSLAEEAGTLPDSAELTRRLEQNGDDHGARLDLATHLFLRGQVEEAIDQLLIVVKKDRDWQEQAARKQLIKIFEALGPADPVTVAGRRRLSAVLFS